MHVGLGRSTWACPGCGAAAGRLFSSFSRTELGCPQLPQAESPVCTVELPGHVVRVLCLQVIETLPWSSGRTLMCWFK